MDENTRDQLIDLNRKFYQTFAEQFSATRQRLQPGVIKIIPRISKRDKLLDLGCGNGEFGKELFRRGHRGVYVGIDSNPQLLDIAQTNLAGNDSAYLLQRDLTSPSWDRNLPHNQYEVVSAFAVLHHIPSSALRQLILEKVRGLIAPGSIFIHSEWQFLNS
ncbi:MAG: class I SAM-dependent methyltransferase, partial [Chloroflexota bacterium]